MQGSRFMLGPNAAYDEIAGTQPGAACSRRDLVAELIDALGSAFGLMLGMTGSCALALLISIISSVSVVSG